MTKPPAAPSSALADAMRHHQSGNLGTAERLYKKVLDKEPRNPDAWYLAGYLAIQRGDPRHALTRIERSLALRPAFAEGQLNRGNLLMELGRAEDAVAAWRAALAIDPGLSQAHGNLSLALERLGRPAEALEHRIAAARAGRDVGRLMALAQEAFAAQHPAAALSAARGAVELAPARAEPLVLLADIERNLGLFDLAEATARKAVAAAPERAEPRNTLGQILFRTGRAAEAAEVLGVACRLDPNHMEARHFLALTSGIGDADARLAYARAVFDHCADSFETVLVDQLGYDAPRRLAEQLAAAGALTNRPAVVDLGCGTGLCAGHLRAAAGRMVGVDLAPRMVERSRALGLYDEVCEAEIVAYLDAHPEEFDLAVAADVLIYIGDAAAVFAATRRALRPGGWFAFSIEVDPGDGVAGRASGRFGHGLEYIRRLGAQSGFAVVDERHFPLRKELGVDLPGAGFVLAAR